MGSMVTKGNVGTEIGQNPVKSGPTVFSHWSWENVREPVDLRKPEFSWDRRLARCKEKSDRLSGSFFLIPMSPGARLNVPTPVTTASISLPWHSER